MAALLQEFVRLGKCALAVRRIEASAITPSDALFVIDLQHDFLPGGAFGVAEGSEVLAPVAALMKGVFAAATVVCSRDYHPHDHCSFASSGGPFPAHCVQGTRGAELHPCIVEAIQARRSCSAAGPTHVAFKGFASDIDSFGALPYTDTAPSAGRLSTRPGGPYCAATWTGAFVLQCSNATADPNAPPDVMAVLKRQTMAEALAPTSTAMADQWPRNLYVCGLTLDFCVLDTALNAAKSGLFDKVRVILSATRAAHIGSGGAFGSGFVSDPAAVVGQLAAAGIELVEVEGCTKTTA